MADQMKSDLCFTMAIPTLSGIILCMCSANERWRYTATSHWLVTYTKLSLRYMQNNVIIGDAIRKQTYITLL